AVIDYDLKRYSCNKTTGFSALPALERSDVGPYC
ncbi:DNA-binding protein, partial [Salmonella enterica subsp. enterica serovar Kottbus]|nr:DNA-binding protein [Salmonella enterica subsp. enterica serovar Kottbus]